MRSQVLAKIGLGRAAGTAFAMVLTSASLEPCAASESVTFASLDKAVTEPIPAELVLPSGHGPFPAWVLIHGCNGKDLRSNVASWGNWLVKRGYATLTISYLPPRHASDACGKPPTHKEVSLDALGAAAYLRSRADIDGARIGAMGWSHGGGAAWWASEKSQSAMAPKGGFRAAVAFYPGGCAQYADIKALANPVLLLEGDADDLSQSVECAPIAKRLADGGNPMTWHIYHGATHEFDNALFIKPYHTVLAGISTMYAYDPQAAEDAANRIDALLGQAMR